MTLTPDELLNEYVRRMIRDPMEDISIDADLDVWKHLETCPDLAVTETTGSDGTYGCETGCSFMTLTADAGCPHHPGPFEARWGNFGDLDQIMPDLAELEEILKNEAEEAAGE